MEPILLPGGEAIPALGLGTWGLGEQPARRREELATVRLAVELGMTLIDTAEMYGEGATEAFLGEALAGLRDRVFLVSKVYPHNASRRGVVEACGRSLRRLGTDHLDLYLLHWPGHEPLAETLAGFEALRDAGLIRHWGVSNFDTANLEALYALPGGDRCAVNQVLYNLTRRGPEFDLLPWMRERGLPLVAYSPLEQGRLANGGPLVELAAKHRVSRWQLALAWVLGRHGTIAIPKTASADHLRANHAARNLRLTEAERASLDTQFPPPRRRRALEML